MDTGLELQLLGGLHVKENGSPVTGFISSKAQAALCYLAVTGRPHLRSALAGLLWPDMPEASAKTNLRMVLANLRKVVGPYLHITRQSLAFDRQSKYRLDVDEFTQCVQAAAGSSGAELLPEHLTALQEATDLYRGDFLAGFSVRDAPTFEEWVLSQQEHLREMALEALYLLAAHYSAQGPAGRARAIVCTTRLLSLDPWREEAHRQLMRLLARSGQPNRALAQYHTCRQILAEELGVEPMPETSLLFERIRLSTENPRHNLPAQTTPFVGREQELAELTRLLTTPACRLLTLTGPGGVGKTRLALQAATDLTAEFINGVRFVPLAGLRAAEGLLPALAHALDFSLADLTAPRPQLLKYLQAQEILLLFDNFEQLLSVPGEVGLDLLVDILHQAPDVKMLVTSQERLNLQGEQVFELAGLACPDFEAQGTRSDRENDDTGNAWRAYDAVRLFEQSARRSQSNFSLERADLEAVGQICRLVQGIPLGLELAASWVRALSCAEIAAEIARNLDFLATTMRDLPPRHRSMRAVFTHSWRSLSESEQQVFRRLSVFAADFSREAAELVAESSLPVLAALVDKSLLRRTDSGRYEMHQLIHHYAAEKLGERPQELADSQLRHSCYYADFLRRREARIKSDQQPQALAELEAEFDNIRAAWNFALAHEQVESLELSLESLYHYCEIQGRFEDGEEMFQQAVAWLSNRSDVNEADLEFVSPEHQQTRRVLAELMARRGGLLDRLGQYDQARNLLQTSLSIFENLDVRFERAFPLYHLGYIDFVQGHYGAAQEHAEASLTLFKEQGDKWGIVPNLNLLGDVMIAVGDVEAARRLFEESLAVAKAAGNREGRGWAHQGLGDTQRLLGAYSPAIEHYQAGLAIFERISAREGIAWANHGLGDVAVGQRAYQTANLHYRRSLAAFEAVGDRASVAETLNALGKTSLALGEIPTAKATLIRALQQAWEIKVNPVMMSVLVGMARLLIQAEADPPVSNSKFELATELLWCSLDHPASDEETKEDAEKLLAALAALIPAKEVERMRKLARTASLEALVRQIRTSL